MKRAILILTIASIGFGGTWAAAQTATDASKPKAAKAAPRATAMGNNQMMGRNGMGGGMMGPMMMGMGTHLEITNVAKGVTITMTNDDPMTAARLQKMAEAMRLMHEAMDQ